MVSRTFRPAHPVDLRLTLGPMRGPSLRFVGGEAWRATRTPDGPATTRLTAHGDDVTVQAWGQGATWALEHAADVVGAGDDDSGFVAHHRLVADAHRRFDGLRIPRTGAVLEALLPAIVEQKVTGKAARESWRRIVRRYSEPAPGPLGWRLWLPPDPARLARVPSYAFHPLNVEAKRADTIRRACAHARSLEDEPARLTAVRGIGAWTYAQVALVALGDADAVPVGDFHVKNVVAWNLAGRPRGTDDEMLELLEPYRGQRGRVIRLIMLGGTTPPKYGPRMEVNDISAV